jgi:hypothetical protein
LVISPLNVGFSSEIYRFAPVTKYDENVQVKEDERNEYRLLVRKPKGKKPLGRHRNRWVDNIKMDLGEVGWGDVDWIGLAKDRNRWRAVVNVVMNLRVS